MRTATSFRLLLVPAALFAMACDDSPLPQGPLTAEEPVPVHGNNVSALAGTGHWAAAYLHAGSPTSPSYAPLPYVSYNSSGGPMNITKPAGTTGR